MPLSKQYAFEVASNGCEKCHGLGRLVKTKQTKNHQNLGENMVVCSCVPLAIFRGHYARYRRYVIDKQFPTNFIEVAKRTLSSAQYELFNAHFILGADWELCGHRFKITTKEFFGRITGIQEILGYALFDAGGEANV